MARRITPRLAGETTQAVGGAVAIMVLVSTDLFVVVARANETKPGDAPGMGSARSLGDPTCYDESRAPLAHLLGNTEDLMARSAATHPELSARLRFKLACGYFRDACLYLARLLAHPRIANGGWRGRIRDAVAYWWRSRAHVHRLAASLAHRRGGGVARCRDAGL